MAKKPRWKGAIESWEKVQKLSQKPFVMVLGEDPYFCDRIQQWWRKKHPGRKSEELPTGKKEFRQAVERASVPSIFSVERAIVAPAIPEVDIVKLAQDVMDIEDTVFLGFLGKRDVTQEVADWFKRRPRFSLITLDVRGRFDWRKLKWAEEITGSLGMIVDDRAIKYLLEWCQGELSRFEGEALKLKLLTSRSVGIIGRNYLEKYWPPQNTRNKDLDQLAGGKLNDYFYELTADYRGAENAGAKKQVLGRYLRLLEQMRILAFVDRDKPVKDQIEQLRKLSKFPMTEGRVEYLLKNTRISQRDIIRFFERSAGWSRKHFIFG